MSKRIIDEFSDLPYGRQRIWQLRKLAKGLCAFCGRPAVPGMTQCVSCHDKTLSAVRKKRGIVKMFANTKFIRATSRSAVANPDGRP